MRDLTNVIPEPLNRNKTINDKFYSYSYLNSYIDSFNSDENNKHKLSISYYATSDFSGQETSYILSKGNCPAIRKIPKIPYKLNTSFYIPSIGELSMAMENVQTINNVLKVINKKTIDLTKTFISSTLHDKYTVWSFNMTYAKLSYCEITDKNCVLPFFRYVQAPEVVEELESTDILNSLEQNYTIPLLNDEFFFNYIYYDYPRSSVDLTTLNNYHYFKNTIDNNTRTFIGYPYAIRNNDTKNITKKTKLNFYIIIPKTNDIIINGAVEALPNAFLAKYQQLKNDDTIQILNEDNLEITMYTFDNYLDIFNMNYKESFNLELVTDSLDVFQNFIIFKFDHYGYFNNNNCLAVCFEVKYYENKNLNKYNILFKDFYYYNNYNILIAFPYTNRIQLKYLKYHSQKSGNLVNDKYVYLNNYKFNNEIFKYYLTDFPMSLEENVYPKNSQSNDDVSFNLLFDVNQNHSHSNINSNTLVLDNPLEDLPNYYTGNIFRYCIRTYDMTNRNKYGIFGIISGTQQFSVNLSGIKTLTLGTNGFNNNIDFPINGLQKDILFMMNNKSINIDTVRRITIHNGTRDHINIWVEDEAKRLCVKKVRLCLEGNQYFVTAASRFVENYYIKIEIESYNKYKFGNGLSYSNICIKIEDKNDDVILEISKR